MPIDPQLLDRVLGTPIDRDVTESPIVTAVILADPANAADLVPALGDRQSNRGRNARRIVCLFDSRAVTPLLVAARGADPVTTTQAIEVMWAILAAEDRRSLREILDANAEDLGRLLDDKRRVPDAMPDHVERDFVARICDLAYVLLRYLMDPKFERSLFRGMDDRSRDEEIKRFKARGFGLNVA